MSVIILLAVGLDYNLLLVSRFKEEIHAGVNTGIIRSMGGTGSVVTSAGLVFAFTMMSMVVGNLVVVGQVGTTIGLGLLFDTLIIRSFMTPSIAALMGRWFWWPQRVETGPGPCHGRNRRGIQPRLLSASALAMKTQRDRLNRDVMKGLRLASIVSAVVAPALVWAAPAHADPDTDFANELHTYGIYGQKDYNAWIGKIACKRLDTGLDPDAYKLAAFISAQLQKGQQSTEQSWQFLGAALRTYCPDKMPVLEAAAQR